MMATFECTSVPGPSHKGMKLKSDDVSFNLKLIEYAKHHGNTQASKYFHIDRKRVREWRKVEAELKATGNTSLRKRRGGGGRKVMDADIDAKVGINYIRLLPVTLLSLYLYKIPE